MSEPNKMARLPVKGPSSLSSLQPIDAKAFKNSSSALMVWASIFIVWLLSLLPWRQWPMSPDIIMVVLAFWTLHEPRRVSLLLAFVLGLTIDVHDISFLGEHALSYTIACYGVLALSRRLHHFEPTVQMLHLLPVFTVAMAIPRCLHAWFTGDWAGWSWLWSAAFTTVLWVLVEFLLLLPHRRLDDASDGTS